MFGCQGGLAHRGTTGKHDQVRMLQTTHQTVQFAQACGNTGKGTFTVIGGVRHLDGFGQGVAKRDEPAFAAAGFCKFEQAALGIIDLLGGGHIDRGVEGDIDHVLADADQIATDRQVVDGPAIIFGVDDRGGITGQAQKKLGRGQIRNLRVGGIEGLQRDWRRGFAGADQMADLLVDILVSGHEKMMWFQKV